MEITKLRTSLVLVIVFNVLIVCTKLQIIVYGSETLPWGVARIHAQCVWDNNMDMTVDEGANAGQAVSIAVIDGE